MNQSPIKNVTHFTSGQKCSKNIHLDTFTIKNLDKLDSLEMNSNGFGNPIYKNTKN